MSGIVNLRTMRKRRKRAEDRAAAAARAAASGEGAAAKALRAAEASLASRRLDAHRVAPAEAEPPVESGARGAAPFPVGPSGDG